jgi:chromosome segregation ATPase
VVEEITAQLETSEADWAALNQRLGESETRRAELARELEVSQADRAARLELILSLQGQIEELATTKAALMRVAAAVARRLGIYHLLKRQKQRFE